MMKRVTTALLLIVLSTILAPNAPMAYTAPAALTVWTQDTAMKVQPTTALGSGWVRGMSPNGAQPLTPLAASVIVLSSIRGQVPPNSDRPPMQWNAGCSTR